MGFMHFFLLCWFCVCNIGMHLGEYMQLYMTSNGQMKLFLYRSNGQIKNEVLALGQWL